MKVAEVKPIPPLLFDDEAACFTGPLCCTDDDLNWYMAHVCEKPELVVGGCLTLITWCNCKPQNLHWN